MQITVLIADDHEIVREGLRSLCSQDADIRVVAEAQEGRTAVQLVGQLKPAVAVIDIAMPEMNGIEATRAIAAGGETHVVVLSMHSEPQMVSAALEAGARGFVLKESAFKELKSAI